MKNQTLSRPVNRELQAMKQNTVKPSEFNKSVYIISAVLLTIFGLITIACLTFGTSIY